MATAKTKITKPFLDKLGPGKDQTIFDKAMPRFGVRVRTSGKRTFIVQFRNAAGQTRKITLGELPDTHSCRGAGMGYPRSAPDRPRRGTRPPNAISSAMRSRIRPSPG